MSPRAKCSRLETIFPLKGDYDNMEKKWAKMTWTRGEGKLKQTYIYYAPWSETERERSDEDVQVKLVQCHHKTGYCHPGLE